MQVWLIASYKINEIKKLKKNLENQEFNYLIPKIKMKTLNNLISEELLFPGYVFIHSSIDQYSKIKYTKGIKDVLRFDSKLAILSDDEINHLIRIESESFAKPLNQEISIGQKAAIKKGPFKELLITIASLPKKDRVDIFINILGSKRKASVSLAEIDF